jgi:DNA-binding MarR family transcriptional regulator
LDVFGYDQNVSYENIRERNVSRQIISRQKEGTMGQESKPERTVRRLISQASDLKHRRVHELLDELGLGRGQVFVLYALWEQDGITQSELTERLNRSPSTITKTVQRMEKAGFVKRCPDNRDERVSRVYLTDAGREIRPAVEEVWNRLDRQIFGGFSAQELALLRAFLLRVCQNIENTA